MKTYRSPWFCSCLGFGAFLGRNRSIRPRRLPKGIDLHSNSCSWNCTRSRNTVHRATMVCQNPIVLRLTRLVPAYPKQSLWERIRSRFARTPIVLRHPGPPPKYKITNKHGLRVVSRRRHYNKYGPQKQIRSEGRPPNSRIRQNPYRSSTSWATPEISN